MPGLTVTEAGEIEGTPTAVGVGELEIEVFDSAEDPKSGILKPHHASRKYKLTVVPEGATPRLETGAGPLASGAPISLSSTDLTLTSLWFNRNEVLRCETNELSGSVIGARNPAFVGELASAGFVGDPEFGAESPEECGAHILFGGRVLLTAKRLPWRLEVLSGAGSAHGNKPAPPQARIVGDSLLFEEYFGEDQQTCVYQGASLAGAYTPGQAMVIALSEQKLTRVKTSKELPAEECPATTRLNGQFAVTSGGEPVTAEL